jgi:hypothetical protein
MVALRDHSLTLYGPAPTEVIPPVDRATLDAALRDYLAELLTPLAPTEQSEQSAERLADRLLNGARCLYGLRAGRPCTKREAAVWLAAEAPDLAAALDAALTVRRGECLLNAVEILRLGFETLQRGAGKDVSR